MHRALGGGPSRKGMGGTPQLRGGATLLGPALSSNTNVPGPFNDIPRDRLGEFASDASSGSNDASGGCQCRGIAAASTNVMAKRVDKAESLLHPQTGHAKQSNKTGRYLVGT